MEKEKSLEIKNLQKQISNITKKFRRRPKMLVGKPGLDGHSNGAEQIAVRARDIGLEVVYDGIRSTPDQLVTAAIEEGVHIIGLSILITYLEKEKIILGYIEKVLDPFINTLDNANDTDVSKMLTSFYNISQLYYDKIPLKYMQTLQKLPHILPKINAAYRLDLLIIL